MDRLSVIDCVKTWTTCGKILGMNVSLVPHCFISSSGCPAVFDDSWLTKSTSPAGVKSATRPGILSTSRREFVLAFAQCFIGYGELACALRNAFVQFFDDSPFSVRYACCRPMVAWFAATSKRSLSVCAGKSRL